MIGRFLLLSLAVFSLLPEAESSNQQLLSFPTGGHLKVPSCVPPADVSLPFGVIRQEDSVYVTTLNGEPELNLDCGRSTVRVVKAKCDSSLCNENGKCRIANANLPHERFSCACNPLYRGRFCEEQFMGRWHIWWLMWFVVIVECSMHWFAVFRHPRQSLFRSPVDHLRFVDILNGAEY